MYEELTAVLYHGAILFTSLMAVFYLYIKIKYQYFEKKGIPYESPIFPLGSLTKLVLLRTSFAMTLADIYKRNKQHKLVGFFSFWKRQILVKDIDIIKLILTKDFDAFVDRGVYYNKMRDPMSANLFTLKGSEWRWLRNKLAPTLSSCKLKGLYPLVVKCVDQMVDYLHRPSNLEGSVECNQLFCKYEHAVVANAIFGLESDAITNDNSQFVRLANKMLEPTWERSLSLAVLFNTELATLLNVKITPKETHDYFTRLIKEMVDLRKNQNIVRNDYLQLLIQLRDQYMKGININERIEENDGYSFSDEELTALSFMFVIAGTETSSTVLSYCLYELALNEEIQQRLRLCLSELPDLDYGTICGCDYLDMFINETMRMHPVFGFLTREATRDYHVPGTNDMVIEKGTQVFVSLQGLHTDPDLFPEPDLFDPERFSKENKKLIKPFTYMPFGEGPRICVGLKFAMVTMKIALARILLQFLIRLDTNTPIPLKADPRSFITKSAGGLKLRLVPLRFDADSSLQSTIPDSEGGSS